MKAKLVIVILAAALAFPPASHGFALARYVYDGICNQLGLDRGPIPKAPPRSASVVPSPPGAVMGKAPVGQKLYIQAEGF